VSEGVYAVIFDVMGLSAAAGFALAFVRRARALAVAGVGLATLAVLTRHRQHGAAVPPHARQSSASPNAPKT
jgi:hypothetical protein